MRIDSNLEGYYRIPKHPPARLYVYPYTRIPAFSAMAFREEGLRTFGRCSIMHDCAFCAPSVFAGL